MWNLSELARQRAGAPERIWSEAELADAWQEGRYAGGWLVDCCGRHLRVVFPGRRWGGPGPDFVGAVLAQADGALIHGDVEVHRRASSWAGHQHARDPAYQQVVLHVVHKRDALALDGLGRHVPTVELVVFEWAVPRREAAPCLRAAPAVLEVVQAAGRERFRARAARFEADLTVVPRDQVLWRGVCEALGYTRNTRAFGQLAEAVAWPQAAQTVAERGPVGLAGLLLGTAGLLAEATLPEAHAWRTLQRRLGCRPALSAAAWDRRQLRAANTPAARCRGLAELAARWTAERWRGPADQVLEVIAQAASSASRPSLWRLVRAAPWIGRGRAQVVAINVLLPFAAAAGLDAAAGLFERLPGEPSNRVVRYMAQQLGAPSVQFRGACHQQGLLHLFQMTCAARRCERCPARGTPGATKEVAETSNG
ncbi:MAG: DUF2851 family protein [Chloroflexi bacterium]|nr:DUF2851 family protein [Chloroflexota bacterium]